MEIKKLSAILLAGIFCLFIFGCGQNAEPAAEEQVEAPPVDPSIYEVEDEVSVADSEVVIGDSYEVLIEKMGAPKGAMKAGATTECLLYPSATVTLIDKKVTKIEKKTAKASNMAAPVGLENDPGRRKRLIEMMENRLDDQLRRYDELKAERAQLRNRLSVIGPKVDSSKNYADYYEIRYASSKQYRLDWQDWRRRYDIEYTHRKENRIREDTYKRIADEHRDEQMSLENEAYDIEKRLDAIASQMERIERGTRPDLETIAKLRAM